MIAAIGKLLDALVAIPKIAGYIESLVAAITFWYVNRQNGKALAAIADAAAFAGRAKTQEDRYAALDKWRAALQLPRVTP